MLRRLGLFLVLIFAGTGVSAAELTVSRDGSAFRTVTEALAAARSGDTIRLTSGVYQEDLTLDRTIHLEGVGKPRLRGSGRGSVIVVNAPGCTVRGLVIEHCGNDLQNEDSGILLRSSGNRVENNDVLDILYGIYLYGAQQNIIRGNTIRGRPELEMGERGAGLHLWNSPDNLIENNRIYQTRDGLYIQSSPGNTIRHNRVYNLRYGVHYMFSDRNTFEDNVFAYCIAGAAIMYSYDINFRRNAFVHNRGFSSFGILFQECERCLAEGNFIIDNAAGIFMEALRDSRFYRNVIAENDVALLMFSSVERLDFCNNNFVQNLSPLQLVGRSTTTRWNCGGRGNYWSDYTGYDLNGDGTGDVPHKIQNIFDYMEGNHPRLRLYLESPAAHALALTERLFPVVRGSQETDRAPLMRAVPLRYPFEETEQRMSQAPLGFFSLGLLGIAVVVVWWGRRK